MKYKNIECFYLMQILEFNGRLYKDIEVEVEVEVESYVSPSMPIVPLGVTAIKFLFVLLLLWSFDDDASGILILILLSEELSC